ncbi:hypothetical protein [Micromonospora deserti]|uniref:Uncharacterized protein n=1 Tax=Micromonospora deserti TaxID=2070366 RepID=A0A2W2DEI7_9ACTN|nr:hypothetical protein [Micromonospora deserti]PZF98267.1 hypothetical protein C1I99_13860 [Micromonospora deserti]
MTRAPSNLLAVRRLLLAHLNVDESRVRSQDLEPAEVGIVGDRAHRGGYHCGSDRVVPNDYSVVESPRDRAGLTTDASALDVGLFEVRSGGRTHNLYSFSTWCVGQCVASAPDTRDIREIIYSPDGKVVRRWDRLGRRSSGDSSHLWHTHFSWFRDSIKAGRDQTPLFRRYLTTIGLIEGDDMTPEQDLRLKRVEAALLGTGRDGFGFAIKDVDGRPGPVEPLAQRLADLSYALVSGPAGSGAYIAQVLPRVEARLAELAGKGGTDVPAIVAGVLAELTPEKIAEAIPPTMARQLADELARRLAAPDAS